MSTQSSPPPVIDGDHAEAPTELLAPLVLELADVRAVRVLERAIERNARAHPLEQRAEPRAIGVAHQEADEVGRFGVRLVDLVAVCREPSVQVRERQQMLPERRVPERLRSRPGHLVGFVDGESLVEPSRHMMPSDGVRQGHVGQLVPQ